MNVSLSKSLASGLAATSALALLLGAMPARADDLADGGGADPGVARLSVLAGNVDVKRADSGDTVAAAANSPVSAGDYVTTHADSHVEVQYGYGSAVRVAPDTQLRFTHLETGNHALQLAEGTVEMRVFRGVEAHPEVETPAATIRPKERGQYRVSVTNEGNTEVTVRSGRADVITQRGTQTVSPESTLLVEGQGDDVRMRTIETVAMDGFDRWNAQRDGAFEHVRDYAYVDQGIVGADDLDQYGQWVDEPTYGRVWSPNESADWSPYRDGRWVWESYYGWTWIGAEPWGYAPYHYGNWFYANNGWFWYPGYARAYRPALVGFFSFGFGGGGFSIGFGNIGWVPLAPNEPFRPWWGRGYDRTTIVNNITNIRNVTIINNYRNLRAPSAAVAVSNANFANGDFKHLIPVHEPDFKSISAVRGVVPVVPTQHNLVYNSRATAPSATAAAPSARFASFKAPTIARQSFAAQRENVATAAQRLYPEHASAFAHPASQSATSASNTSGSNERNVTPAERNVTAAERNTTPAERNVSPTEGYATNREATPAERTTSRDPWSRFGASGTNSVARPSAALDTGTSAQSVKAPRSATPATEYGTRTYNAANDTSSGAWHRFNGYGSSTNNRYGSSANAATSNRTSGTSAAPSGNGYGGSYPNRYGSAGRHYDSGATSATSPASAVGGYPRSYGNAHAGNYGSSSSSTHERYGAPAARPAPVSHAAAAAHPASPGTADRQASHDERHGH